MNIFDTYFDHIPERLFPFFHNHNTLWGPLDGLKGCIEKNIRPTLLETQTGIYIEGTVEIGEGTIIEPGAVIYGPTIIGKQCHIRAHAYIRGNVVTGDHCVIGHATEITHSILFDHVRVDHFNYIGDSILGNMVHFGAGAKVANLRFDEKEIVIDGTSTGRKKFGVIMGDSAQLGVNVSVGPGVIIGKHMWFASKDQKKSGYYTS